MFVAIDAVCLGISTCCDADFITLKGGIDLSIVGEGMELWGASAVLYPALRWEDVVLANVVVLLLGFLASLSPVPTR